MACQAGPLPPLAYNPLGAPNPSTLPISPLAPLLAPPPSHDRTNPPPPDPLAPPLPDPFWIQGLALDADRCLRRSVAPRRHRRHSMPWRSAPPHTGAPPPHQRRPILTSSRLAPSARRPHPAPPMTVPPPWSPRSQTPSSRPTSPPPVPSGLTAPRGRHPPHQRKATVPPIIGSSSLLSVGQQHDDRVDLLL